MLSEVILYMPRVAMMFVHKPVQLLKKYDVKGKCVIHVKNYCAVCCGE